MGAVHLPYNTSQLPYNIFRITCIFWLAAKLISYKAWFAADRLFPIIPVFKGLQNVQPLVHTVLFWLSVSLMLVLLITPRLKALVVLLLITEISSCLLDVARWQPWEYQYIFMAIVFCYSHNKPKVYYNALVFIIASIYIFSGFHKLNGGFLYTIWENMMLRSFVGISQADINSLQLHYAGLFLPVIEIFCGLLLLFIRNKKWPAFALIAMHLFNLVFLGPWGLNYNSIVWPWNAAMILFLYFLFIYSRQQFLISFLFTGWNRIVLLCFGILPILSFWRLWPSHFSSDLYSGKTQNLAICVEEASVPALKNYFGRDKYLICNDTGVLKIQKWALGELNLPPYPEEWYYSKFIIEFEKKYPNIKAKYYVYTYPYKQHIEIE